MRIWGIDVGFFALACSAAAAFGLFLFSLRADRGVGDSASRSSAEDALGLAAQFGGAAALVLAAFLALAWMSGPVVEREDVRGWELAETRALASAEAIEGDGRALEGSVSGGGAVVFGLFGGGSAKGAFSEEPSSGVYIFVEATEDGGYRRLAIDAEDAVIYGAEEDYRAELWRPVVRTEVTKVEDSWLFPSASERIAESDGPAERPDGSRREEWRVYVPEGSVEAGGWNLGPGSDGSGAEPGR